MMSSDFDENAIALHWSEAEEDVKNDRQSSGSASKNEPEILSGKKRSANNSGLQSRSGSSKRSGHLYGKDVMSFNDVPELDNEEFWSAVPRDHLLGRFAQYRQLSMASMSNLLDEMDILKVTNTRQVYSLKSQHQLHKNRWDEEREMLIEAVRNTEGDRKEAQNYAELAMKEIENFASLMKLDEKEISDSGEDISLIEDLGLLDKINQIKDYLIKNNLFKSPISDFIEDLQQKFQIFQERTKISLPKFVTMMDLQKNLKFNKSLKASETQTEKSLTALNLKPVPILDEDRDILFPEEEDEDVGKKSVAVSASPTLIRISFFNDAKSATEQKEERGVTSKDIEIPRGMVDIEDRTGLNLIQHPVVTDYLHSYDQILTFKEQFLLILEELDKIDVSEFMNLKKLNPVSIRSQSRIIPQIEEMGKSIEKILQTSLQIIERILLPKSKREVKVNKENKLQAISSAKGKQLVNPERLPLLSQLGHMQEECKDMKRVIKVLQQSHQSKFSFINNSISKLKQLFFLLDKQNSKMISTAETTLNKNQKKTLNENSSNQNNCEISKLVPDYDSVSIYFNRRDFNRNSGRMQQAILENDFPELLFEEAVDKMSQYLEIPSKQLFILVQKYLYKDSMQKISDAVKQNGNFTEDTFRILNKMEISIEKKHRHYREVINYWRNERILRAKNLVDTLDKIEQRSSLLMIKPIFVNKSRDILQQLIETKDIVSQVNNFKTKYQEKIQNRNFVPFYKDELEIQDSALQKQTWNPNYSVSDLRDDPKMLFESKLFTIETNRMLLPMNNVSVPYNQSNSNGHEFVLPPQIAVRSYVAVVHPTLIDMNYGPSNSKTPSRTNTLVENNSKSRMSKDLSKHIPLPPISPVDLNRSETPAV